VAADYEQIRAENIARYGWDTAVLDLLGQLYSERTHFLFELIQNAEDADATELAFELFEDRLELRHDGRPFTEADVRGLCGIGKSAKSGDLTAIGKFGIGFKSVYAYTKSPRVHSAGEHFRIENYVRPFAAPPRDVDGTLFVFPFDHDTVSAAVAAAEIAAALNAIAPRILLFLEHIERLRADGRGVEGSVIERSVTERSVTGRSAIERSGTERSVTERGSRRRVALAKGRRPEQWPEQWLVWSRTAEGLGRPAAPVELAFRVERGRIAGCDRSPLTVFFPTDKETYLGFLVQGPYRTTPARDNIPEHDPSNQVLVRETAALLTGVLRELRDGGLLTAAALAALPVDAARFPPGSMFRPLFDAVRDALAAEPLLPSAGGGYRRAAELRLARDADLRGLLGPEQLGALYGAACFTDAAITADATPALWRYLVTEIGIGEVTAEDMASRLTGEFLQAQPDEWIIGCYRYLYRHAALWRPDGPARAKPLIRLEDGRQVAPFDAAGRPAVYLPGPSASGFPTVRRSIAASAAARPFLEALNLAEPDVVAEVLELILPRYRRLDAAEFDPARQLDRAQHDADLDCVMRALDEAPAGRHEELLAELRQTAFLVGENAATGRPRLMPPPRLYQRSKDLETYFDGNPDAWFADDVYGPWLPQLRRMGVRQEVAVRARTPDPLGHVVITVEFGRNERGLDGFDPGAEIDGLDFALRHPGHERSEYAWNALLVPNRRLAAGVVERSVLASFGDSRREMVRSAIAVTAQREAWLPGPDGIFRRPAELSLDDLPAAYTRDEGLAEALGMSQPVVAQAARRLGIPPEVLWGLSARPDLVAMVQRELGTGAPPANGRA